MLDMVETIQSSVQITTYSIGGHAGAWRSRYYSRPAALTHNPSLSLVGPGRSPCL
jgi:hypothetical protein